MPPPNTGLVPRRDERRGGLKPLPATQILETDGVPRRDERRGGLKLYRGEEAVRGRLFPGVMNAGAD